MRIALLALVLAASSCRQRPTNAPYARGDAPDPAALLEATAARYGSLRVPKAKIREGRSPGARLQLRAEAPARMVGGIDIAGNPLVTLAIHERGYALRSVRDAPGLAAGFYSGPPSDCAVGALLGVDLSPTQIVALLLGGGPVIDGPHEQLDQAWIEGREHVRIANAEFEEELEFAWVDGGWWFGGAKLYARSAAGPIWLWTIHHEGLTRTKPGADVLPSKTTISRPNAKGGSSVISIAYSEQVVAALGTGEADSGGDDDGGDGDGSGGFDDGGGWEDDWDEDGWDEDDARADASTTSSGGTGPTPSPEPTPAPEPEVEPIPAAYVLEAAGLPSRGDLCR